MVFIEIGKWLFLHLIIQPYHQNEYLVLKDLLKHTKGHKKKEVFVFVLMVSFDTKCQRYFSAVNVSITFYKWYRSGAKNNSLKLLAAKVSKPFY